jgi:hypothetical protein
MRLLVPALLFLAACAPTKLLVDRQVGAFTLASLKGQRVAVWPIAAATVDDVYADTVDGQLGTRDKFLDALSRRVSDAVLGQCRQGSLGSEQVVAALDRSEATRPFLDAGHALGRSSSGSRFATPGALGPEALAALPFLDGFRYALLFPKLDVRKHAKSWMGATTNGTGPNTDGPVMVGRLSVVVVDLETRTVTWEGTAFGWAMAQLMYGSALTEIEEEMVANLVAGIDGRTVPEGRLGASGTRAPGRSQPPTQSE